MKIVVDPEDTAPMKTSKSSVPMKRPAAKNAVAVKTALAPKARKVVAKHAAPAVRVAAKPVVQVVPKVSRAAKPVAPAPERVVRRNKRSDSTIASILKATEEVVLRSGAERVSIMEVCEHAEVSRGTFYRYFSSQDELLDAYSLHKRQEFHRTLVALTAPHDEPQARLRAVIKFLEDYLDGGRARRLLLVAPEYALGFFERTAHDGALRFQEVLGIVFDDWDRRFGTQLDRELICELIIRSVLSELVAPAGARRHDLPARIGRLVSSFSGAARPRSLARA